MSIKQLKGQSNFTFVRDTDTEHIYGGVLMAGILIWLLSTAYFGWNQTAQSGAERVFDMISGGLMLVGMVGEIAVRSVKHYLSTVSIDTKLTVEDTDNDI